MERVKLPSYLNSETLCYRGKRISLYVPSFSGKNGKTFTREIVTHPGAVVILPFLNEKEILLIRNYRAAVDEELLELPAGTLEPEENPKDTAARELIEETGYAAEHLEEVTRFYTTPGFTNEQMIGYIAKNLTYQGQKLEESEEISVVTTPWIEALSLIKQGKIQDAKTITLMLFAAQFHRSYTHNSSK